MAILEVRIPREATGTENPEIGFSRESTQANVVYGATCMEGERMKSER